MVPILLILTAHIYKVRNSCYVSIFNFVTSTCRWKYPADTLITLSKEASAWWGLLTLLALPLGLGGNEYCHRLRTTSDSAYSYCLLQLLTNVKDLVSSKLDSDWLGKKNHATCLFPPRGNAYIHSCLCKRILT